MTYVAETVGIVMPCYDAAPWIAAAIKSVVKQSVGQWHLVVVDDGSHDRSETIARRALTNVRQSTRGRIEFVRQRHEGLVSAVATGMQALAAQHEQPGVIMCMGADDLLSRDYVLAVVQHFGSAPRSLCAYPVVCEFGDRDGLWVSDYERDALRERNTIPGCAAWRRTVWDSLGGFDPKYTAGNEDWAFAARVDALGMFTLHPPTVLPRTALYYHRARQGSLTSHQSDDYAAWCKAEIGKLYAPREAA